jgi:hypothetical protein
MCLLAGIYKFCIVLILVQEIYLKIMYEMLYTIYTFIEKNVLPLVEFSIIQNNVWLLLMQGKAAP